MRLWETMYKEVIKNKQSCILLPKVGTTTISAGRRNASFKIKRICICSSTAVGGCDKMKQGLVNRLDLSSLSAPVLDSVPEASGYFCKGGLSGFLTTSCSPC